jgi:ABC-type cobalt transport system substrate-binding protein
MDRFTVYAAGIMAVLVFAILISSYIGHTKGRLEGTDDIVESIATSNSHVKPKEVLPAIPENLEPIGFTLAGIVGGFIVGYFWEELFGESKR